MNRGIDLLSSCSGKLPGMLTVLDEFFKFSFGITNDAVLGVFLVTGLWLIYRSIKIIFLSFYYFLGNWGKYGFNILFSAVFMVVMGIIVLVLSVVCSTLSGECDCSYGKKTYFLYFVLISLKVYLVLYISFLLPILNRLKTQLCEWVECKRVGYDRDETRLVYRLVWIFGAILVSSFPLCEEMSSCMILNFIGIIIIFLSGFCFEFSEMKRERPKTKYVEEKNGPFFIFQHLLPYFILITCMDPMNITKKLTGFELPYSTRFLAEVSLLLLSLLKLFSESIKLEPFVVEKGFLEFLMKTYNLEKEEDVMRYVRGTAVVEKPFDRSHVDVDDDVVLNWIKKNHRERLRCVVHAYDKYLDDYHRLYGGDSITKKIKSYKPYVCVVLGVEVTVLLIRHFLVCKLLS